MKTFYLGIHRPNWVEQTSVPVMLSRRVLVMAKDRQRRSLPRARGPVVIDSAGFTELNMYGHHHVSPRQYAEEVCRYHEEIGNIRWASVQDWMVEPTVRAITRKSVAEHQRLTIESLMTLRTIAPGLPWAPVLQGWFEGDHNEHLAMYAANGIDLRCEPIVGVGSVCRRQGTEEADRIVRRLAACDLKLHLFGYKATGLPHVLHYCESADSMAWSQVARKQNIHLQPCKHVYGETKRYKDGTVHHRKGQPSPCNNCLRFALKWRAELLRDAERSADPAYSLSRWGARDLVDVDLARYMEDKDAYSLSEFLAQDRLSTATIEGLSGRKMPTRPRCHFLGAPGEPCVPAEYTPRSSRPVAQEAAPKVRAVVLPKRPGRPKRFQPWRPRGVASAAACEAPPDGLETSAAGPCGTPTFGVLGAVRLDPFRERAGVLRGLHRGGIAGVDLVEVWRAPLSWLSGLVRLEESPFVTLPDGLWSELAPSQIVDRAESDHGVTVAARVDEWLRFGPPAPVVLSGGGRQELLSGAVAVDLMRLLGQDSMPAFEAFVGVAPRKRAS